LNESSSDEEELNINIPASQSGVAAQKQQNINGSTVQNDNFTDRDEARIKLILEFFKKIAILFSPSTNIPWFSLYKKYYS